MRPLLALLANLFVFFPAVAQAADWDAGSGDELRQVIDSTADLVRYFIQDLLPPVGGAIVVLMVVWGSIQYITGQKENGKKTIFAAIIGAVIIVLAYVIVRAVSHIFVSE